MADGAENTDSDVKNGSSKTSKQQEKIKSKDQKLSVLETHGYSVAQNIGSGSYAVVKIAYSQRHDCNVAIKIVSKLQGANDYLQKFLPREIEVVKGLKHDNLIKYYQAIETTHRVYIIMEFAENGSLLEVIKVETKIEEDKARKWFNEIADVVEYCHLNGVVHRDIKCENLLLDSNYNIKLSDFGFARNNMIKKNGQMRTSNTFCGSYAYASPEILRGIPYQPNASDVWSVGVVLYAMVFGSLPFDDTTYHKLLKHVQKPVEFPKGETVSSSCKHLILKLISPLKTRLHVSEIKHQPWCQMDAAARELAESTMQNAAIKVEPKKGNTPPS